MFSVVVEDDYKRANEQLFESVQILGVRDSVTQVTQISTYIYKTIYF